MVFLDQLTKYLAVIKLKNSDSFKIIKNVLELTYTENTGAAFGILEGMQWLFYILTVVVLIFILYLYNKTKIDKRFYVFDTSLVLIFSGAIGNFIDRIRLKYVVDFIYFVPINFPVFNVADICITIGCVLLFLSLLIVNKNDNLI